MFTEIMPAWATEVAVTLPRVTVPLKECPAGITVADPLVLESMPRGASADEALSLAPGFQADNPSDQGDALLSVRGAGALNGREVRGVLVLLDGIPLTDPSGTTPDLLPVDWFAVERVEALRGPVSALFGAGGAAGATHIVTRDGPRLLHAGRSSLEVGSDRFWKASIESSGGNRRDRTYRVTASRTFGAGYRDHATFWSTDVTSKFRWNLDSFGSYVSTLLAANEAMAQDPGGLEGSAANRDPESASGEVVAYDSYRRARNIVLGVSGKLVYSDRQDITYSAFGRWAQTRDSLPGRVEHGDSASPGTTLQYNWHRGRMGRYRSHLSMGFDASWSDLDLGWNPSLGGGDPAPGKLADGRFRQKAEGVFLQNRMAFGSRWTLTLSAREDSVRLQYDDHLRAGAADLSFERTFRATTLRAGATVHLSDLCNIYASWGQGYLPPSPHATVDALVDAGPREGLLTAARSRGMEVGVRGAAGQSLYFDAALFYAASEGEIPVREWRGMAPELPAPQASTARYGAEAALSWFPLQGLGIRAAYTFSRCTFDRYFEPAATGGSTVWVDRSDNRLPNAPEHRGHIDLQYAWQSGWKVALAVDARSRFYADASNSVWAGGYCAFHPRASYAWERGRTRGEVTLTLRNAFGREYAAWLDAASDAAPFYPAPGRSWFLGVRLVWDRL